MKLTKEQWLGILRHTLTFVGGVGITLGKADESQVTEAISLSVTAVGLIWSILSKK